MDCCGKVWEFKVGTQLKSAVRVVSDKVFNNSCRDTTASEVDCLYFTLRAGGTAVGDGIVQCLDTLLLI